MLTNPTVLCTEQTMVKKKCVPPANTWAAQQVGIFQAYPHFGVLELHLEKTIKYFQIGNTTSQKRTKPLLSLKRLLGSVSEDSSLQCRTIREAEVRDCQDSFGDFKVKNKAPFLRIYKSTNLHKTLL